MKKKVIMFLGMLMLSVPICACSMGNASFWEKEKIPTLGADAPMKRAGQTFEIAPLFVYLASDDSSYVTGQVMHINGGLYKG